MVLRSNHVIKDASTTLARRSEELIDLLVRDRAVVVQHSSRLAARVGPTDIEATSIQRAQAPASCLHDQLVHILVQLPCAPPYTLPTPLTLLSQRIFGLCQLPVVDAVRLWLGVSRCFAEAVPQPNGIQAPTEGNDFPELLGAATPLKLSVSSLTTSVFDFFENNFAFVFALQIQLQRLLVVG